MGSALECCSSGERCGGRTARELCLSQVRWLPRGRRRSRASVGACIAFCGLPLRDSISAAACVRAEADICNPPHYSGDAVRIKFARRNLPAARFSALSARLWHLRRSVYIVAPFALAVHKLLATPRRATGYGQRAASRRELLLAGVAHAFGCGLSGSWRLALVLAAWSAKR